MLTNVDSLCTIQFMASKYEQDETRCLFNLRNQDARLFYRAKSRVERGAGVEVSRIHVIRLALRALIEKEKYAKSA